mgnify:CR=1 FL=1
MTQDTPEFRSLQDAMDQRAVLEQGDRAVQALREAAKAGRIERVVEENPARMFLSPTHPNAEWLIQIGKLIIAPFQSAVLGLPPAISRDGDPNTPDVFVVFNSGVCTVLPDDEHGALRIAWLEAHSGEPAVHADYHTGKGERPRDCAAPIGLCHEQGPGVDVWAQLKAGQVPTARRAATTPPEIDIDAFLRGDHLAPQPLKTGEGARMAEAAEADKNAARERAKGGNRN